MMLSGAERDRCRRGLWVSVLALLCAFFTPPALLGSSGAGLHYSQHVWHVQDGLPEETVQAIQQTPDGYLWIGTTGGLARFNGTRFLTYSHDMNPDLTANSVFCLLAARDGTLWLGTEGGGLLHLEHGKFQRYGASQGLTDGFVRSLIEDDTGQLWVGTDNGLFRVRAGSAQRVDTSQFTTSLAVHAIYEDHQHRIWVGGSRLLMFEGDRVQQFKLPGAYSQNRVKTIVQTSDGTVWVGTVGGVQRLRGGNFESLPGIAATVRTLRQTADGTLWIGTIGHGLFTLSGGELRRVSGNGLLPSNTVLSMAEDSAHQIWVGTQDGLVRLSKTPVEVVPLPEGSDPDFETISYDPGGTIWAVSSQVYTVHQGRAQPYLFKQIAGIPVRNVFRDRQGTLWIGTDGSGAFHLTKDGPVHYSAPNRLANNFVRGFLQSRDNSIWIATDEGVSRIAGGHVRNFSVRDGLAYFSTRALMEDHDGRLWIGTDQGLSCWDRTRFVQNEATRGLDHEKIWSILQDSQGVIWFGTRDHGLFKYRDGSVTQFTTGQGLASDSIYQLLEDHLNQLWVSSPNSISSVSLAVLDRQIPRLENQLPVTIYNMPYEAGGAQMYGGRQPSGCIDKDGSIWFPSNKGAVHIWPEPAQHVDAPKLLLTRVAIDGREVASSDFHVLSADASRLEIAFAPLSLRPQDDTRFRFRLEPFDRAWTYAGTNRLATYTNLPPGRYQFRVAAFPLNNPGVTSDLTLNFRKQPHFYRTWWFLSLCVLMLGVLSLASYRWRMRLLQARFRAVLDERNRLAREMHDTVIQGCTSISALLEAISSLERENQGLSAELLPFARTQVRSTINEARQAVWNLRHGNEPRQDLFYAASLMAEHTMREFGIPVDFSQRGTRFPVPNSTAHEVLMVVREALYNAVLHGKPSRIWIEFNFVQDELRVQVRDDGIGFTPGTAHVDGQPHYGIAGMQERIERLGGIIDWTSSRQGGTMVRFRIKRASLVPVKEEVEI